jgi:hypothetical protein
MKARKVYKSCMRSMMMDRNPGESKKEKYMHNNILIDVVPILSFPASVAMAHLKVALSHSHIHQTSSSEKPVTTQYPFEVPNTPKHDRLHLHTSSDYKAY